MYYSIWLKALVGYSHFVYPHTHGVLSAIFLWVDLEWVCKIHMTLVMGCDDWMHNMTRIVPGSHQSAELHSIRTQYTAISSNFLPQHNTNYVDIKYTMNHAKCSGTPCSSLRCYFTLKVGSTFATASLAISWALWSSLLLETHRPASPSGIPIRGGR